MELAQPAVPDRRPSPGLALNLSSNNPFRNRATSPAIPSPALPSPASLPSANSARPVSKNPFLNPFEEDEFVARASRSNTDLLGGMATSEQSSEKKPTFGTSAEELFKNLSMEDKPKSNSSATTSRPFPPQRSGTLPIGHRPSRSEEEERRMRDGRPPPRGPPRPRGPPQQDKLDIFASPERRENRRPRRNSESSIIDKGEDERRRRERRERHREREARGKDSKSRSTRTRPQRNLDLIDKLDVTSIYGPGLFHHDGPFDACNPHRNRKKDHRAPMQAFPANSANNALGGSGPVNKNIDLDQFHGRGTEGFTDYAATLAQDTKKRPSTERAQAFDPIQRVEPVHGEESYGLGTSTFLDGAPASRTAIQRRESENEAAAFQGAGITRKKSLAQRIRGISQPRRFGPMDGRIMSPDGRYEYGGPTSPDAPNGPRSAGLHTTGGSLKTHEKNPFFDEYSDAHDKKGADIKVKETESKTGQDRTPSSPLRGTGLQRSVTADPNGVQDEPKVGGGFLNRVKSLKGGRRTRPQIPQA